MRCAFRHASGPSRGQDVWKRVARVTFCDILRELAHPSDRWQEADCYGTRKGTLLESVPPGVTTWTVPVVAPAGTVAVIKVGDFTVKVAVAPLKVTLVAPVRSLPRILTAAPTAPEVGCVSTNGERPTERLKTVPSSPFPVVP
jgi:hypothetical protein